MTDLPPPPFFFAAAVRFFSERNRFSLSFPGRIRSTKRKRRTRKERAVKLRKELKVFLVSQPPPITTRFSLFLPSLSLTEKRVVTRSPCVVLLLVCTLYTYCFALTVSVANVTCDGRPVSAGFMVDPAPLRDGQTGQDQPE
jgi:hypothetical protein